MAIIAVATPNTIMDVVVRIHDEIQEYPKFSTEFNRRVFAMISILSKLDDDELMYVICKVTERVGNKLTLDNKIPKKLTSQKGCTTGKVHATYSYKKR